MPGQQEIQDYTRQATRRGEERYVVIEKTSSLVGSAGPGDKPRRPAHHNGQPLAGVQGSQRAEARVAVRSGELGKGPPGRSLGAGKGRGAGGPGTFRQHHHGAGLKDGKIPAIAGDVEIELVLGILATINLATGQVADCVAVTPCPEPDSPATVAISPGARVCILLAQIMLVDGRLEEAAERLDQAEKLAPRHGGIFLARGDLYAIQRRPQDAIAAYKRAQRVDPYRATADRHARTDSNRFRANADSDRDSGSGAESDAVA